METKNNFYLKIFEEDDSAKSVSGAIFLERFVIFDN